MTIIFRASGRHPECGKTVERQGRDAWEIPAVGEFVGVLDDKGAVEISGQVTGIDRSYLFAPPWMTATIHLERLQ